MNHHDQLLKHSVPKLVCGNVLMWSVHSGSHDQSVSWDSCFKDELIREWLTSKLDYLEVNIIIKTCSA